MRAVQLVALGVAVLALGDFWLRALVGSPVAGMTRLGLGLTLGLAGLPLVALVLHAGSVFIDARSLAAGLTALTLLVGGVALARGWTVPRHARTLAAVAVPGLVALVVGVACVRAYDELPHPPQPGYTSLALAGWAARIDRPVDFPAAGLTVPVRLSRSGEPSGTATFRVLIGDRPAGPDRAVTMAADHTRTIEVHVPAPPDGCPYRIEISLGPASTVFYGRGPGRC